MYEIQRLEEERKSLRLEKERLGDAFDAKLRRAQTLYETELHASKALYSKVDWMDASNLRLIVKVSNKVLEC